MKTKKIREIICMLKRKYDFVGNPQHGLIKVIRNKKYGFVDINMKIVIPLEYDWSNSVGLNYMESNILVLMSVEEDIKQSLQWMERLLFIRLLTKNPILSLTINYG